MTDTQTDEHSVQGPHRFGWNDSPLTRLDFVSNFVSCANQLREQV